MVPDDCERLLTGIVPLPSHGELLDYRLVMEAPYPYGGRIESSLSDLRLCLHHLHHVLNPLDIQSVNHR